MAQEQTGEADKENYFMGIAFEMAEYALKHQEVPVGCVVVHKGRIIARGCNEVNLTKNATRHAEMVAVDHVIKYCTDTGTPMNQVCSSARMYVTVEPCIMCAFALRTVGFVDIVFGCCNDRFGGCGSVLDTRNCCIESSLPHLNARATLCEGVVDKAMELLQRFYESANPNTR